LEGYLLSRVLFLPLDERPCNTQYPQQLAATGQLDLLMPPAALLGSKKQPADCAAIHQWLLHEAPSANVLIVSIDMLVYGGIVPSRLHSFTEEECLKKLSVLEELKSIQPQLKIYGFNLIMRVPAYNSNDEEPDYYAEFGQLIHRYAWLTDKQQCDGLNDEEDAEWDQVQMSLPGPILENFTNRRRVNAAVNKQAIALAEQGILEQLIIPLDDNAKYGFSAMEQRALILETDRLEVTDRVHLYPGADEIGCTLLARVFCEQHGYTPELFVRYSSTHGPFVIPRYEDRSLQESIKAHITAAGAFLGDSSAEADFILLVNSPPAGQQDMAEAPLALQQRHRSYFSETNLREFVSAMRRYASKGYLLALADVAASNGADRSLMNMLARSGQLSDLAAYAAWNTSGNTLGTVIAHAIIESYYKRNCGIDNDPERARYSKAFLLHRLIEDWGYQTINRAYVAEQILPQLGGNYFDVSAVETEVTRELQERLTAFKDTYLQAWETQNIRVTNVHMPWKRMFEIGFQVELLINDAAVSI
jgi:hypothetical protein